MRSRRSSRSFRFAPAARTLAVLALAAPALLPAGARAQDAAFVAAAAAADPAPSLRPYAGRYALDGGGTVEVRENGGGLFVTARGGSAARLAPLADTAPALDTRAAAVLDGWVRGDLAPAAAALPAARREAGRAALARFLRGLTDGRAVTGYRLAGTFTRPDGRAESLAEVAFAGGVAWVRLLWHAPAADAGGDAGRTLLTVVPGVGAFTLGRARPAGRNAFRLDAALLIFQRGADDRIVGLVLRGPGGPVSALRVAPRE